MSLSAECGLLRTHSDLGQVPGNLSSSSLIITSAPRSLLSSSTTYLCMVLTSAGRNERRFPDRLSSVREVMSHRARGNSDRALLDRLRLLSLQNLQKVRDIESETQRVRVGMKRADTVGQRYKSVL